MHRPKLNVIQFKNQLNANELAFNALTGLTLNSTRNPETHSNTDKNKQTTGCSSAHSVLISKEL